VLLAIVAGKQRRCLDDHRIPSRRNGGKSIVQNICLGLKLLGHGELAKYPVTQAGVVTKELQ
jgi:hypothetical protein